ncbi:MAG TPA: ribosomal L7Ae/L30e/S12e/Gadd45 family protein [Gemmatimonadales bacterium]|nr:ribosomal L7Ae/L30e/S12e/Gadd45 family protein [Gemmatimonadales bacterium]
MTGASKITRLLGLGVRAGNVVIGVAGVRAGLQRGKISCVVLAADASQRTIDKVARLAEAKQVPTLRGPSAEELGAGLGKPPVQAVGVNDPALARGLIADS